MIYTDQKKRTFSEMVGGLDTAKHNSDIENLANAAISIRNKRKQIKAFYDAYTTELNETEARVVKMATDMENGEIFDVRDVQLLHELAHRPKTKIDDFEIYM